MIRSPRSAGRGGFRSGWTGARFASGFGSWQDPVDDGGQELMLRNDDGVAAGADGFAGEECRPVLQGLPGERGEGLPSDRCDAGARP